MKLFAGWSAGLALVAVALFGVRGTEGQTQSQAATPALSRVEETLKTWNEIGNKLVAMARDFPEDRYDFKLEKDSGRLRRICSMLRPLTTTWGVRRPG
jgi:hypothetical protein